MVKLVNPNKPRKRGSGLVPSLKPDPTIQSIGKKFHGRQTPMEKVKRGV